MSEYGSTRYPEAQAHSIAKKLEEVTRRESKFKIILESRTNVPERILKLRDWLIVGKTAYASELCSMGYAELASITLELGSRIDNKA